MSEVVRLKKTRLPTPSDAFYQAIPLSEIQGRYFTFARQRSSAGVDGLSEVGRRARRRRRQIDPNGPPFEIVYHPEYGTPGPLAYRIWAGLEKIMSDAGTRFDGEFHLTIRQLAQIAGRSYNGGLVDEILEALDQLRYTNVHYWYRATSSEKPEVADSVFSLLDGLSRVRENEDSAPYFVSLRVSEEVRSFIHHDRLYYCMSWSRLDALDPKCHSLARILYRYLSYRYSESKDSTFTYCKDYASMCTAWFGGITPLDKSSAARVKHLAPRLEPIIATGLLERYEIVANKRRTGFNVTFHPGPGFFKDFERFYQQKLPIVLADHQPMLPSAKGVDGDSDETLVLLQHFSSAWFGMDVVQDFLDSDVRLGKQLLEEFGHEQSCAFIDWAIVEARKSDFRMRTFSALKSYRAAWKSESAARSVRAAKEAAIAAQSHDRGLQREYDKEQRQALRALRAELTDDERDALRQAALLEIQRTSPTDVRPLDVHIKTVENRLLSERESLAGFDAWKINRRTVP